MALVTNSKKSSTIKMLMANFESENDLNEAIVPENTNINSETIDDIKIDPVEEVLEEANQQLHLMTQTPAFSEILDDSANDDEECVCSRKSSYSSLQNGHAGAINQTNRRCSQNSASSSSNNIYSTSQQNGQHSNNNSISNIPQVPSAQQMNGQRAAPPPAPPPPPNGVAAVSTKAPPPPPPPPPDFKLSNGNKSLSLADQLKNQQLRKTSGPPVSNGLGVVKNVNETSPPAPQPKPSTTGGHTDLLSELAAKIESRNSTKNCKADTVSTSSSSGVSASDGSDSGGTLIPNSAASNRKFGPNGDGPTTGRTWQKPNGIVTAGITAAANSNGIDSPKANKKFSIDGNSPAITAADLSNLKQEILTEIKQEIAKAKQEIMEAIRIQLSR